MTSPFARGRLVVRHSRARRPRKSYDGTVIRGARIWKNSQTSSRRTWRAFLAARSHITQRVEADLAAIGKISLGELEVLSHLQENGGTMRMSVLADKVHASRSGLTRRVDRMARQGLVVRRSAPEDKRGAYTVLTEAGREVLAETMPHQASSLRTHVFAGVTDDELATLTAVLEKLVAGAPVQDEASLA